MLTRLKKDKMTNPTELSGLSLWMHRFASDWCSGNFEIQDLRSRAAAHVLMSTASVQMDRALNSAWNSGFLNYEIMSKWTNRMGARNETRGVPALHEQFVLPDDCSVPSGRDTRLHLACVSEGRLVSLTITPQLKCIARRASNSSRGGGCPTRTAYSNTGQA